jgi:hypothetical protein
MAGNNSADKKAKDKKSRMLRNLRKSAPVSLTDNGEVLFNENAESILCLTSQTADYEDMGTLNYSEASILVCQSELAKKR